MNYAEMEAGPEMDRLVAERVMGIQLPIEYGILYKDGRESWGQSPGYTVDKFNNYHGQGIAESLLQRPDLQGWSPSENIAHAWEVLTAIRQRLFSVRNRFSDEVKAQMVTASGERIAWPDALFFLRPEHICRAALMALKPEGE